MQQHDWRPIATIPKNGERVILAERDPYSIVIGRYNSKRESYHIELEDGETFRSLRDFSHWTPYLENPNETS